MFSFSSSVSCKNCGNQSKSGVKFCPKCGNAISKESVNAFPTLPAILIAIAIFAFIFLVVGLIGFQKLMNHPSVEATQTTISQPASKVVARDESESATGITVSGFWLPDWYGKKIITLPITTTAISDNTKGWTVLDSRGPIDGDGMLLYPNRSRQYHLQFEVTDEGSCIHIAKAGEFNPVNWSKYPPTNPQDTIMINANQLQIRTDYTTGVQREVKVKVWYERRPQN